MTPEEKAAVINFLLKEEQRSALFLFVGTKSLVGKLEEEWKDAIFLCPGCDNYFTWDDSVKVGGDIIDGKAGSPSETVCRGCSKETNSCI